MPITTLTPNPWRYLEGAIGHSSGFQAEAFDDSAWAEGNQAFGKNDLSYDGPIATPWDGSLDEMCVRGHFTVPADATAIRVKVRIDLNGTAYLNGASLGTVDAFDNPYKVFTPGSWNVGDNLIAVRGYADEQQNRIAVVVELVYPDEAVAWDIFAADDLNGPIIATLADCSARSFRVEEDGSGSGAFTLNRHAPVVTAANLARGNLVRVRIPEVHSDYIAAFFLENGDFDLVSSDEQGGEDLKFGGRGALTYLRRARMWSEAFTTGLDVSDTWAEVWKKSMTNPVGSAVVSTDQAYVYVINATDRRIRKVRQSDRAVVRTSPALWAGADKYAGGLGADPSDDTILWVLESPWAFGGSGNTKIRKVRISDWAILATIDLGSALQLSAIKADSSVLYTTSYSTNKIQKRNKTTGAVTADSTVTYGGVLQTHPTGISVNGTRLAYWFAGTHRALIANSSALGTIVDKITTTGLSAFGGDWTTESGQEYFYPVTYTADVVWKYQLTSATPHDPVDGQWRLDEATPGAILARIVDEIKAGARPQQPVPDLTYGFGYTTDTDGNDWDAHPGTIEFTAQVGDYVDDTVLRLVPYGLTLQMQPDLELRAYNEADWGTDRTSATYAAGKVRVAAGINIAEGLAARSDDRERDSHLLVTGEGGTDPVVAIENDLGYVREGHLSTSLSDEGAMAGTGEAELERQRRDADAQAVVIPWGDDEAAGLYMPGPPGSSGHYWVGDTIRVHTGTGAFDLNEADRDVKAITIEETEGGWRAVADLASVFVRIDDPPAPSGSRDVGGTSGAGSTTVVTSGKVTVRDTSSGDAATGSVIESDDWGITQPGVGRIGVSIRGRSIRDATDADLDAITDGQGIAWDDGLEAFVPADLFSDLLPTYNVLDYGLVGDNVTDDTPALIALIALASASGTRSCRIRFPAPPVKYLLAGALQDTGARNAQVPLPIVPYTSGQIHIIFEGDIPAPTFGTATSSTPTPTGAQGYSVIRSSLTGASGTAACFGAGVHTGTPTYVNNLVVSFKNLCLEWPSNPTFTMINLRGSIGSPMAIKDCMIYPTGTWPGVTTRGSNSNAYGVRLGQFGGSNYQRVQGLLVIGGYTGLEQGELADVTGFRAAVCHTAVEISASIHPSVIRQMQQTACTIGIDVTGSHYALIELYGAEHYTAGDATTFDLNDPSNFLHGGGQWVGIAIGGANDHTFLINGGTNSHWNELGALPASTPSGAAGGDLSGTYPNPSVVDDSHSHTTATAPGGGSTMWKPVMDGLGNVVTDSGTGEAIMAEVAP